MNWLTQVFRSKTVLTVGLNGLTLAGFMTLRLLQPTTALRPTLGLPHTTGLSVATWIAARLADVASLIQLVLDYLL